MLLHEEGTLLSEGDGINIVDAADVMTWGPLKVTLELSGPPMPSKKLAVSRQQCFSLDTSSPESFSANRRLSSQTVHRQLPSSQSGSGILCCVRSPSHLMMNRIKRWITPVNTPQQDSWSVTSEQHLSSEDQRHIYPQIIRPSFEKPPPPIEVICYGVLTGQLGLLLFVADVAMDECKLVYTINLKNPQAMGTLSTDNATTLRIQFIPGDLILSERAAPDKMPLRVRAINLDVGLPTYTANWLNPLGSVLITDRKVQD